MVGSAQQRTDTSSSYLSPMTQSAVVGHVFLATRKVQVKPVHGLTVGVDGCQAAAAFVFPRGAV